MRKCSLFALALAAFGLFGVACALAQQYEVGGPLAGIKLPLFPTQNGEPPGFPGCVPGNGEKGEPLYPRAGNPPLFELYPGSVELWRDNMHRYVPSRPMYDAQSQIRNWTAPEIPGASPAQVESYASPVYWVGSHSQVENTGKFARPVPVVRCKVKSPVFKLPLGELDWGLYTVRVIAAVPTADLRPFRKPVYIGLRVNDGLNGEISAYRVRISYVDEFYSVAEIHFHAPAKRNYQAELWVDDGSTQDLLVHNISLDDDLAGMTRRAVKTRSVTTGQKEIPPMNPKLLTQKKVQYTPEERLARDEALWQAYPPVNAHLFNNDYPFKADAVIAQGVGDKTGGQIEEEFGKWEMPPFVRAIGGRSEGYVLDDPEATQVFLLNKKLNLRYTVADWLARKPLPDPYPYKDDGCGLYTPDLKNPVIGRMWAPIAQAVTQRYDQYYRLVIYSATDNATLMRDRAVMLVRLAYDYPTLECSNTLMEFVRIPTDSYDERFRRRMTESRIPWAHVQHLIVHTYDDMFNYIKGNEELAQSVHRFVPWVKTADDVIMLLDTHLLQMNAKRWMRYHYYRDGHPGYIVDFAALEGDRAVTDPWMEWGFARAWMYPLRPAGLPDYLISNCDRTGISYIGSIMYGKGATAAEAAQDTETYIANGGNPKFDLGDPKRFPKPEAARYFPIEERVAAVQWPRVGDVTGPDKAIRTGPPDGAIPGWHRTHDPQFAYIIKTFLTRDAYAAQFACTDAEWAEIEKAAATISRPPWLDNRSRLIPNWAAVLEAGVEQDDFRFRRAVMLRNGQGYGHHHEDSFDLQIAAHGIPMVIDAGQRHGYSTPRDDQTRVHNTVEVAGLGNPTTWIRAISDMEGARYLCGQAARKELYRRQVALLDVDAGSGAKPLTPQQCLNYNLKDLPQGVVTPNSYIFDVFRVTGGDRHTYCFHGPVNDPSDKGGPQPKVNALNIRRVSEAGNDAAAQPAVTYLKELSGDKYFGAAPVRLEAVFEVQKKRFMQGKTSAGTEQVYLGAAFDPASPTKFLKLHLFNAEGALVMKGDGHCTQWEYFIPDLFVQRSGPNLQSAFAAVIEPYAGVPFITEARQLDIAGNEADAARAVALEIKTVNGHTDLCFADGHPEKTRKIGAVQVSGEFAYYSTDADGLRQASLTGGTSLVAPGVRLTAAAPARIAHITKVDYPNRTFWIDRKWPAEQRRSTFEMGSLPEDDRDGYMTTYTALSIAPEGEGSAIHTLGGADLYRCHIQSIDAARREVACTLRKPIGVGSVNAGFVASNEAGNKFWRAALSERDGNCIATTDGPVREEDFAPEGALRLWEYGVGDSVRRITSVNLRRIESGLFELNADVDVTVELKAGQLEVSSDRAIWRAAPVGRPPSADNAGFVAFKAGASDFAVGPLYLRLKP